MLDDQRYFAKQIEITEIVKYIELTNLEFKKNVNHI